jgi:hypothetical protein
MARAWKKESCPGQIWLLYLDLSERNDQYNNDDDDDDDGIGGAGNITAMEYWSVQIKCLNYNLKHY